MTGYPKEVEEFAAQARTFISWCQSSHIGKNAEKMQLESLQQLSQIYSAALRLPAVDFQPAPDPPSQTDEGRSALAENLRPLPFQYYWEVFTPSDDKDKEPVCGDLFDDFLDICGDLASGLWLFDRGYFEAAVFSWSQMFTVHWGRHAVSAMHAIHSFEPNEAPR